MAVSITDVMLTRGVWTLRVMAVQGAKETVGGGGDYSTAKVISYVLQKVEHIIEYETLTLNYT